MKAMYEDVLWVNLLHLETLRSYSARPERLFDLVHGHPGIKTVVIDEVQKVLSLLSVVRALIEKGAGIDVRNSENEKPLFVALREKKGDIANLLGAYSFCALNLEKLAGSYSCSNQVRPFHRFIKNAFSGCIKRL